MVDGIDIEPIAEGGGIALTIGTETALIASEHVPNLVAANTSEHGLWLAPWLMWAVCCGVMHGLGFHPRSLVGRVLFFPWLALPSLLYGLWLTSSYYLP